MPAAYAAALESLSWVTVTVGLSVGLYLFELFLDVRQARCLTRARLPDQLQAVVSPKFRQAVQDYNMRNLIFNRVESAFGLGAELVVLLGGYLESIWAWASHASEAVGASERVTGLLFILLVSLLGAAVKLPLQLYREVFVLHSHSALAWVHAQLLVTVLSLAGGLPVMYTLLWTLDHQSLAGATTHSYWTLSWFFLALLSVTISDLYATFVAPCFEALTPLPAGELRDRLEALTRSCECPVVEIYITDGDHVSAHGNHNAYFQGVGTSRSIVLARSLLHGLLSTDEVVAVIAHECGHVNASHWAKSLILEFATMGVFFAACTAVVAQPSLHASFGFARAAPPRLAVGLVLFSYMYAPLAALMHAVKNVLAQHFEHEADAFAMACGYDLSRPLIKLHCSNLVSFSADPLYALYNLSHPSLVQRIDRLAQMRRKRE